MKTKYLLLGAIFAFFGFATRAQVSEMYNQNFESGETVTYSGSLSSSVRYSSSIRSTGNRSLKLVQSPSTDVEVILDTIDFTQNTTLRYIALRFDHICRVPKNGQTDNAMGMLYYKRANQTNWTPITSAEYNMSSGSYSEDFSYMGSFKDQSYSDWWNENVSTVSNDQWRSERFDLDNVMTSSVPANERKLLIKFVLHRRTSECTTPFDTVNMAWWIDNLTVHASSERMVTPKITMVEYPTIEGYPNSRGAHIELSATTTVSAGINPDSVYLFYTGGSDPTEHRMSMTPVTGRPNNYECRIPFYGYDTMMSFYCVVRDATGNSNKVTFPATAESNNTRIRYRCVRGYTEQPGVLTPGFVPTSSTTYFPFPWDGDHRSEVVYDSALLHDAGYGPGAITSLRFTLASGLTQARTDPRFQIKMKNVPANYTVDLTENFDYAFTVDAMQIVYDSALTIPVLPSNLDFTINLQDTFFYSGGDIIMQFTYDGTVDHPSAVNIKTIPTAENKVSILSWNALAEYGHNAFTSDYFFTATQVESKRPAFVFTETSLQPLLYDAGISALVSPNYDVPMSVRPGGLTVKLKNFGERTLNTVQISYSIDDTIFGQYTWNGTLAGGAETNVLISSTINIPAGYHYLCVWTEDSVVSAGQTYRDHEPYNNDSCSAFIVCDGPMSGVRNIGGTNPHFNSIEEFLFSLSRCGIDDSLIVRLAPGQYAPFTMPAVQGVSEDHYIVFESMNSQSASQRSVLYSNGSTDQPSIVNLENVSHVRFRNLDFKRFDGPLTDMVLMGPNSADCHFENCSFIDMMENPVASLRINTMINSGNADDVVVDSCIFRGGNIAVNIRGAAPDDYSQGIVVRKSSFSNQYSTAVKVEYVDSVTVVDNEMMDVLSNTSYVILLNGCSGEINVARNKVYTSHGAGAIALSDVTGTSAKHALVANNMLVSNDDGTANLLSPALNVIQGDWIDVVYNSVKMTAPTRTNVAAASFGGGALNNSRFMNNIVASLDEVNYAFSYQPLGSTTNTVSNNDYYSNGVVLIRRGSAGYTNLVSWRASMPDDTVSISVNPNFLNTSLVDLRTYNRNLKGVAMPLATVTTDIFGNPRGDSIACPGAYEFSSLPYDFEPEALVSPLLETCNMPASVELVVCMRNSGIQVYDSTSPHPLQLSYRVNNGTVHTLTVNQAIPADDTISVHTGAMLNLPSGAYVDATYTIRIWNTSLDDPNPMNDTNVFTILSRYHPAAPADITDSIEYAERDTITPTVGIDTWQVYGNAGAPRRPSTIYWYNDSTDTEPFYVGPTYITDNLQQDAHYYIRQRRAMPIVRITQVELLRTAATVGLTNPMPYWMENGRKAAVQLTNIGDATAYLEGDTLMTVSPTSSLNNKVYTFGNVRIEPGQSLVVQYVGNGVTDSSLTIRTGLTPSFAYNSNVAFIYKRNGVVEDAIAFNAVITTASTQSVTWANSQVPSYVWSGAAMTFPQNTAGVIRTGFNGGVGDWELSTADFPMTLGTTNESWMRYYDYGCEGDIARVNVGIIQPPAVDIDIATPVLPESGCGLGQEVVTVTVSNFGGDTASNVVLHYSAGSDTVSETIYGALLPHSDTVYTFVTPLNLQFTTDSTLTVRVWSDSIDVDPIRLNDTNMAMVTTLFTPGIPDSMPDRVIPYATRDTLTHIPTADVVPIWYDYDLNPVDTGYVHITELLYANGTRGMSYLALQPTQIQVGLGTSVNGNTAFPSPYQSSSKYVKQQYLYSAADMIAMGAERGNITGLSFYLDTMVGNTASIQYLDYTISIGLTSDTIFTASNATAWKDAPTTVFTRDTLTLLQTDDHAWVNHAFNAPFFWDGTSTVVVQISYNLTTKVNTGIKTRYTAKSNTTLHKNQDIIITPTTGSLTKGANRPNIMFNMQRYGCSSEITTFNVTLSNMPQHDVALLWAEGHDTLVYNSCDTISLPIVVSIQGSENTDTMVLRYYLDAQPVDSTVFADTTYVAGEIYNLSFLGKRLSPGRHSVTAVIYVAGDTIASNDTIRNTFTVRFCGGNYTIAANDANADYQSFGAAIDTLNNVGVVGPVTFLVAPGTYTEQVVLNNISGSSSANTISFVGQSDGVQLTASTSQAANYVMKIDGASNVNIENLMIVARPTANNVNYAHALVMLNDSNINVTGCHIKVKGTITNSNASCIVLQGNVSNLTVSGTVTDSGYYAIKTVGAETGYSNIHIHDNTFREFASGGIYIRGVERVIVSHNELRSGNSANNRGLIGIYMAATTDSMVIQKNAIYLVDGLQGAKRGIQLENVIGTLATPAVLVNNMISTYGNGSAGLTPAKSAGIWIDSLSTYINVFYNSVRVRGSNVTVNSSESQLNSANNLTYAFWVGGSPTNISVMNNILSNFGFGYVYYLAQPTNISTSNYNAFYTQANNKFAVGTTTDITSLADWQTQNSIDGNSVFEEPFFVSNENLHMRMTNFAAKAQYNTEVIDDIDGTTRSQIPGPTIGAHECIRQSHDMAVVRIIKPVLPENIAFPTNVETDSVLVVASFNNNGLANESNVYWYAYIEGYENTYISTTRSLGSFVPAQLKTDSVMIPTSLGIIDTQWVHVVVFTNTNDTLLDNNEAREPFYMAPAFNLGALKVTATNDYLPAGCRMQQTKISINVKNDGSKPFPAGTTFKIGYHTELHNPNNITVATLPDTVEQMVTLTNILPEQSDIWFDFDTRANLYPTGHYTNIKVRVKGWVNYVYDITQANDSTAVNNTASPIYDSYYTPANPVGHDTTLAYGTWGEVTAEQANSRAIRWYRDSTAAPYYSPTQYNASKKWSNTPQYFHDSTYYLNALSDKGCPSYYDSVHVHVMPRKTRDVAVEHMLAPLGDRVYMENDTVRVQIANYGSTAQSNFPITYELKRGNNIIQTVTDTVRENLVTDQTYIFTFDTLLNIPTPLTAQNYTLKVWTDLTNDATRRNDTLRLPHAFASKAQELYNTTSEFPADEDTKFDITRVAFNGIDLDIPPLNRTYTNLADYSNPDYPVLHVTRGTTDSIIIQVTQLDVTEPHFRCTGTVHIDYNRDGLFDPVLSSCNELVLGPVVFYSDSTLASVLTIPTCASLGYMRMRVSVQSSTLNAHDGHVLDLLLFVDEQAPSTDLAITQIVSPRSYIIRDANPRVIKFRMANKGSNPITSADIHYRFQGDSLGTTSTGIVPWAGNLDAGQSTVVELPAYVFPTGTTTLTLWHEMEGDVDSSNNIYVYEYHRFHIMRPIVWDDFENGDYWYAPTGYNNFTRNYWQRGTPHKVRIDSAYSGDNAWVTDLGSNIVTGKRGNVSYLYSPVITQTAIKLDTISIRLRRNLTDGSQMYIEFYNYDRKWVKLKHDSCTTWYNNMEDMAFTGTSSNSEGYGYYCISVSKMRMISEFHENTQFRIVYTTPVGSSTTSSFSEGCAVDDFYIGRARARYDAGVVAITHPVEPKYGQTIYPQVVVTNYGWDTIKSIRVGYTYHGTYMARFTDVSNCYIVPYSYDTITCTTPFIVTSDFPEEFHITAFTTRADDIYRDNDTLTQMFSLSPLDKDIMAEEILTPLAHVVAGDTAVRVTLRMRNFGIDPIPTATASYIVNGINRVDEQIDFEQMLGRPLQSLEYFNYTFNHKITAPMGMINLTAIIKSPVNDYIYNDTVTKRSEGIMSVTDVAAAGIILDTTTDHLTRHVVLVIDNVGARGVNNFEVGYWIDNDTTTMVRETYYRAMPIAALDRSYYTFNAALPRRSSGYNIINAYVHVSGDNDPSNDTTNVFDSLYMDLAVTKVQIEENANNDCRVFLEIRNIGNVAVVGRQISLYASINGGDSIKTNIQNRDILPGEVIHLPLNRRIPKSPTRHYVGSGWIGHLAGDNDVTNDQTSIVEVINYFEGAPTVNGDNLVLEQNYPNPFTQQTTIPFTLPNAATVRFFVMDAMGHIVQRMEHFYQAGPQTITVDMEAYAAGVYYYGIEVNGQRQMRKMILR